MKRNIVILSLVFVFGLIAQSQTSNLQPEKFSKKQLASLISSATTPAEHMRIADYYSARAQKDLADAWVHEQMEADYLESTVATSDKFVTGTVRHCEYLRRHLKEEAAKMQALARQHEEMAQAAGQ